MTMYTQINPIMLNLSAAANFNNLNTIKTENGYLLAVHDIRKVSITSVDQDGTSIQTETIEVTKNDKFSSIMLIQLISFKEKIFLIVVLSKLIKIYSINNDYKLLFEYNFNVDTKNAVIMNGVQISKDIFCITTENHMHYFAIKNDGDNFYSKDIYQDLKSSTGSLIYKFIPGDQSQFILIENTGKISVWKFSEKNLSFSKIYSFDIQLNTKATCVQVIKNFILIGTISGQIQIVNCNNGQLVGEIQAHVKCITSLDLAPDAGYLISGSEDSFARLFKIDLINENECQIEYLQQFIAPNEMIFGTKFLNPNATLLAITTFESNQIKLFKLN